MAYWLDKGNELISVPSTTSSWRKYTLYDIDFGKEAGRWAPMNNKHYKDSFKELQQMIENKESIEGNFHWMEKFQQKLNKQLASLFTVKWELEECENIEDAIVNALWILKLNNRYTDTFDFDYLIQDFSDKEIDVIQEKLSHSEGSLLRLVKNRNLQNELYTIFSRLLPKIAEQTSRSREEIVDMWLLRKGNDSWSIQMNEVIKNLWRILQKKKAQYQKKINRIMYMSEMPSYGRKIKEWHLFELLKNQSKWKDIELEVQTHIYNRSPSDTYQCWLFVICENGNRNQIATMADFRWTVKETDIFQKRFKDKEEFVSALDKDIDEWITNSSNSQLETQNV